jgi:hypothetical protein
MRTASCSRRWLTNCEVPVRRRSTSRCRSASVSSSPGGQPSTMQPSAGPWLSPKVAMAVVQVRALQSALRQSQGPGPGRRALDAPRGMGYFTHEP